MKISYILFLSRIGVWAKQGKEVTNLQDDWLLLFQYVAVTLPVLGLLVLQGDMGTALVFLAILAGIVVVSGISWRIILPVVLAFATGLALFVMVFTTDWGKEAMLKMGVQTYQIKPYLSLVGSFHLCRWYRLSTDTRDDFDWYWRNLW